MKHIAVIGANRGLGLEWVRQYLEAGAHVHATCREPEHAAQLKQWQQQGLALSVYRLDVTNAEQIAELAQQWASQPIDTLIYNAGIYGPKGVSLTELTTEVWHEVLGVNTIAPARVLDALLPAVRIGNDKKIVITTSKMGSMADNQKGGSYLYRASKAALNAIGTSLAIDLKPEGISVALLHPGWVQTDMGGPNALITAQQSVSGMREVVSQLHIDNSGEFVSYDGSAIPW